MRRVNSACFLRLGARTNREFSGSVSGRNLARAARLLVTFDADLSARLDEGLSRRHAGLAGKRLRFPPERPAADGCATFLPANVDSRRSRVLVRVSPAGVATPIETSGRDLLRVLGAHAHQFFNLSKRDTRSPITLGERWLMRGLGSGPGDECARACRNHPKILAGEHRLAPVRPL